MDTTYSGAPSEHRRVKYTISQIISRFGDYFIQNYIVYTGGWYVYAVFVATVFNLVSGYGLQKLWAFQNKAPKQQKTWKEVVTFLILRGGYGLIGLAVITILYKLLGVTYWASSLSAMGIMWLISYGASRDLFEGSLDKLPRPIRLVRIFVLHRLPQRIRQSVQRLRK